MENYDSNNRATDVQATAPTSSIGASEEELAARSALNKEEMNRQKANQDILPPPIPSKKGFFSRSAVVLAAIVGTLTAAVTMRNQTTNSRIKKFVESGELNLDSIADRSRNAVEYMQGLMSTASAKFGDRDFDKSFGKAKKDTAKVRKDLSYKLINPKLIPSIASGSARAKRDIRNFSEDANPSAEPKKDGIDKLLNIAWPEGKPKGVVNTALRSSAAVVAGVFAAAGGLFKLGYKGTKWGAEATRQVAFDIGDQKGDKIDEKAFGKLEGIKNKFERDVLKEASKDTKLGFGEHAKNAGKSIAFGAGLAVVTYGATMLVDKFLAKRREKRDMEKYAEALAFEREAAMVNPQTQMSVTQ